MLLQVKFFMFMNGCFDEDSVRTNANFLRIIPLYQMLLDRMVLLEIASLLKVRIRLLMVY